MTDALNYLGDETEDTQKDKYLTFSVGKEVFGLDIRYVVEIIGIQEITEIPHQPEYLRGVINLRGRIIPTMDIRLRFRKPLREYDDRTCIVVLDIDETSVGIIVDTVVEVLNIPEDQISAPPVFGNDPNSFFIKGIGKVDDNVKLLLDCSRLLSDEEVETIRSIEIE